MVSLFGKKGCKNFYLTSSQSDTVANFRDGSAAALNANRSGEGEKDSLDTQRDRKRADLDMDGSIGPSSTVSTRTKMRKIVQDVDEDEDDCHDSDISKGVDGDPSCKDLQLEYVKPVINNANGSVMIPSDVINRGSLPYSCTLYGFFFEEEKMEFSVVESHLRKMWKVHGIERIMRNDKGFYFLKFKTDEGMLNALEHGPWSISNIPIFLKRWTPGLILDKSKHDKLKLPVWVRIYEIPLELWNKEGLSIIGSMIGDPLAVDTCTATMYMNTSGRAGYARVLVDIDVTGNWVDEVSISVPFGNGYALSTLRIKYSWKPPKCSVCKVFGHADNSSCKIRLKEEEEERENKRRYKAQPYLYTIIKVARDDDLLQQIGKDIYFDLVDHDKVRTFHIKKQTPFNLFKEEVAKEFGVPVQFQRFWIWAKRVNNTYRPNRPLTAQEETQSVRQLIDVHNAELKLFLEIELGGPDLHPIPPPKKSKDDILLFFKLYDPNKEEIRYVGSFFVKSSGKLTEIISKLNERAGFSPDEEIELYEEIKFEPCVTCERLDKRSSFRSSQIEDGDIICYQKLSEAHLSGDKYKYPDVPSFLEYVKNRQVVHFRQLDKPKEDDFCLELSKLHTYDDVVERVAKKLEWDDPSKIRLTSHHCCSQQPMPHPIKFRVAEHLIDMLAHYNQVSDILYYQVLDVPLPELKYQIILTVTFHHNNTKEEPVDYEIEVSEQTTVADLLNEIKTEVVLSSPDAELRLIQLCDHKIYKILPLTQKFVNVKDLSWISLHIEEVNSEEEKNMGPQDRLIPVSHFTKIAAQNQMPVKNFGEPFFLVIYENETLAAVKVRIQKKLEIPDDEFSKWKFAFLFLGRPEYLEDSDIVSTRFQRRGYDAFEQYLGLEHS